MIVCTFIYTCDCVLIGRTSIAGCGIATWHLSCQFIATSTVKAQLEILLVFFFNFYYFACDFKRIWVGNKTGYIWKIKKVKKLTYLPLISCRGYRVADTLVRLPPVGVWTQAVFLHPQFRHVYYQPRWHVRLSWKRSSTALVRSRGKKNIFVGGFKERLNWQIAFICYFILKWIELIWIKLH